MNRLSLTNISKSFGQVHVLKDISLTINAGEVHALLGTNGAGKSTLMKIVSGDYPKDSGSLFINNEELSIHSPADAKKAGIGMVVQEVDTALFPALTVAENLFAEATTSPFRLHSAKKAKQKAIALLTELGISLNPDALVSECSLSEKQLLLIAKAIAKDASFIILDEPTAPLSTEETALLFRLIRNLTEKGVGIIYISHRMPEIREISDRFTILRDGRVHFSSRTNDATEDEIISHMIGQKFSQTADRKKAVSTTVLFEAEDIFVPRTKKKVSLTLHEGEIIGIAGLVGAGKSETALSLFGAEKGTKGAWHLRDNTYNFRSPHDAIRAGFCLVPEERRKEGILLDYSVTENLTLPSIKDYSKGGIVNRKKERTFSTDRIDQLGIVTPSYNSSTRYLSGGNQQKVAIGKWLSEDRDVYLFDEPTKGIDVKAKADVLNVIRGLADKGKGVLYFSSEFDELLEIADRILVMYDGIFTAELTGEEKTYEAIMTAATGGGKHEIIS